MHRLGRYTSGLVLFARTREAASELARAWRDRTVKKTYRALALGETRTEMFVIDVPIGPVPHPLLGTVQAAHEDGKPSHSLAVVLQRGRDRTLFNVEITTGRPHQVRIHLAYAGIRWLAIVVRSGRRIEAQSRLPGDGGYLLHASFAVHPSLHRASG